MEFRTYRKGKHSYTRIGQGVEVRDERPHPVDVECEEGVKEVYANRFEVRGEEGKVEVRFKLELTAVPEREVACLRLPWATARALRADLQRALEEERR